MSIDPRAEAARDAAVEVAAGAGARVDTAEPPAPEAPVAAVMALDESTNWADGTTHEALLVIAEGITQLAGFDVAAVSVVRDSQHMQVMAVAGSDEARDILLGTFTPITRLMEELEHAEDWGMFQFVPHENLDPESESWGWVPDFEPVAGPDAWHPLDLLVAPLYGPNGELRGTLSIDCPTDGRRPDEAHRRILNRYAEQAARALYIAVEREAFAEQVRVLSATRDVVRNAARERNIGVMLDKIQPALVEGFRSLGSWIHTVDEDGHGLGAIYTGDGARVEMPQHLVTLAERAATDSWRAQQVGLVSRHIPRDPAVSKVSEPEFQEILRFLEGIGVGSLLFVPVGAGRECLGSLVLTRALGDAEWTPAEIDAALEVGRDLGRAVLNARALDRERELVRELKALDDYKTKLIATLSHELKSPLAAMLANIEYLEQTVDLGQDALAVLAAVDRGAVRLVRVVEDLLLLAKVGDPHLPLLTRPVNLPDVVDDVVNLASIADQRRVKVSLDGEAGQLNAVGDPAELDIMVTNLLSNAIKYSAPDSVVTVTLSRDDAWIVLSCEDKGIGIAPADRSQLFREFFRSELPEVKAQAGTGLGLTIVDRIVTRHLGRIEVESVLGRGSTFRVYLPAASDPRLRSG
jgi:signal transduction histidine kinase